MNGFAEVVVMESLQLVNVTDGLGYTFTVTGEGGPEQFHAKGVTV